MVYPYFFVLLAAILWGMTGTAQTFLDKGVSPIAVATIRSAIGGGLLLVVAVLIRKISFRTWSWKWTILAAASIALFQGLFFTSIRLTGVAIGTVVTIGSAPMFSGVLEWLFWKTRPSKIWGIATIMTITGCILLFINSGERAIHLGGVGLAVCAGLSFAVYTNMSKQLMAQQEALPAVAMTFSICAVLLLPFSISSGFSWLAEMQNLWTMIFMGVMCTSIAYLLFLSGLQKISSSSAVTLSLAEPLTAAMLGVLLVGEHLSSTSWVGVAMLLGGIVVLTLTGRKNK
ncbi:EamA family transporter [Lysinibacillus sphaericus]|uniref:EamA family transporter n=1 Tax=Lysinibacillus sphaericus TaxID=1421 RepID=A0A2S0K5E6_LYSSH|nr:EamA family transporter [Lysinibacillus sphaericus]AVK98592.1 EamA family transporter [Lysinibacillus sphaericus]MED4544124.1 EamA family transporter [Lysinibacillus sphaericus]TKI17328.1 EamA family transporter [Lysinibacillus sphaericus]SUV15431.1 transport protein YwfM [Lysinibacillus sphaericus]GEC83180.1 putative transporter YwfM [Lysinibacillus sphaericus]